MFTLGFVGEWSSCSSMMQGACSIPVSCHDNRRASCHLPRSVLEDRAESAYLLFRLGTCAGMGVRARCRNIHEAREYSYDTWEYQ